MRRLQESLSDFSGVSEMSDFERCVDFARHDKNEERRALIRVVRRDLELVAIGIVEVNRVRDFVILESEFNSALL